jgi:hypothetical protein
VAGAGVERSRRRRSFPVGKKSPIRSEQVNAPTGGMNESERGIMSRVPIRVLILLAGGAFLYVVYLMAK